MAQGVSRRDFLKVGGIGAAFAAGAAGTLGIGSILGAACRRRTRRPSR